MSKRARGVKKGVHNIAFLVRYAFWMDSAFSGAFFSLWSFFLAVKCCRGPAGSIDVSVSIGRSPIGRSAECSLKPLFCCSLFCYSPPTTNR